MKIDSVYFLIAVTAGLLISYGFWSQAGELSGYIAIGSALYLCLTLGMMIGVRHENSRTRVNLSTLSGLFFVIGLIINWFFVYAGYIPVAYIMTTTLSFLVYAGLVNFIQNASQ
jgi:hypothetical protein